MTDEGKLEGITRRDCLKHLGLSTLVTATLFGYKYLQFSPRGSKMDKRREYVIKHNKIAMEARSKLKVSLFAQDIVYATSPPDHVSIKELTFSYFLGDFVGRVLLHGKKFRRLTGISAGIIYGLIDSYSTYKASKAIESSKFKEYGLGTFFYEQNPTHSEHPTPKQIAIGSLELCFAGGLFGLILPPMGTGFLALSLPIAKNNLAISYQILCSLELGNQVENLINKGKNKEEIKSFLHKSKPYLLKNEK